MMMQTAARTNCRAALRGPSSAAHVAGAAARCSGAARACAASLQQLRRQPRGIVVCAFGGNKSDLQQLISQQQQQGSQLQQLISQQQQQGSQLQQLISQLQQQGSQLQQLDKKMEEKMDKLDKKMEEKMDKLDKKMEEKMDKLSSKLEQFDAKVEKLSTDVVKLQSEVPLQLQLLDAKVGTRLTVFGLVASFIVLVANPALFELISTLLKNWLPTLVQ